MLVHASALFTTMVTPLLIARNALLVRSLEIKVTVNEVTMVTNCTYPHARARQAHSGQAYLPVKTSARSAILPVHPALARRTRRALPVPRVLNLTRMMSQVCACAVCSQH